MEVSIRKKPRGGGGVEGGGPIGTIHDGGDCPELPDKNNDSGQNVQDGSPIDQQSKHVV